MSDQKGIDRGMILELLTLIEKGARDAREAICLKNQQDAQGRTMASGLVVAGAAIIKRIQNGDASVANDVQCATPEQATHAAICAQLQGIIMNAINNVVGASDAFGKVMREAGVLQ